MSDLNLGNIVGFKAVDKDGNEQNVTVDEMVDMVSTRMVMALSETSTFAAAAATGNDVYENELPTVTDAANVRVLQSSGDAAQMTMQSLASKLGGLFTNLKLFPFMGRGDINVTSYDEMGALDTVIEMGIYKVKPNQGSWGALVVFNAFDGAGGIVQKLYNTTGAKYRVKKSNTDNSWTDWKSF